MYKVSLHINPLLLVFLLFSTSCNGQAKTNLPNESGSTQKTGATGYPTIRKTLGSTQYDNIHCGLTDKAGNLWFGTTAEGVYRYDGKLFTQFTKQDGLSSNTVWSVLEDKAGNIWFGTDAGLCRFDGKTMVSIPIAVTANSFLPANTSTTNRPSANNAVWSMMQDKRGKLWFGTNEGVYCYNGTSFTRFLDNNSIINNDGLHLKSIQSILEDKAGNLWFASWLREGVCRYDGKSLTRFKPNDDDMVHSILEDKAGNLWFGTRDHGVSRYNGGTGRFANFSNIDIFRSSCIYSIAEDKAGKLWFGTELGSGGAADTSGGVWCYNPSAAQSTDSKAFTNYTAKNGLSHNSVFSVQIDKSGNLWFGTRGTGLCRYDGKTFTNFSEK